MDLPAEAVTALKLEAGVHTVSIRQASMQPAVDAHMMCQSHAMARLIHDE